MENTFEQDSVYNNEFLGQNPPEFYFDNQEVNVVDTESESDTESYEYESSEEEIPQLQPVVTGYEESVEDSEDVHIRREEELYYLVQDAVEEAREKGSSSTWLNIGLLAVGAGLGVFYSFYGEELLDLALGYF